MSAPLLVVADPHGSPQLVEQAIDRGRELAGRADITIAITGDVADNGPDVPGLIERLIAFEDEHPGTVVCVAGNHDIASLLTLGEPHGHGNEAWWQRWRRSYPNGLDHWTPTQYGASTLDEFRRKIPAHHWAWLRSLPRYAVIGDYVIVHAGLLRGPMQPQLDELAATDITAMPVGHQPHALRDRTRARVFDPRWDKVVISGHSKFADQRDFVAPNRITLNSGVCMGGPLHCVLLPTDPISGDVPRGHFFQIQPRRRRHR